MTDVLGLISDFRDRGVYLWADGEELKYRTSSGALGHADVSQLRSHKEDILRILRTISFEPTVSVPAISPTDRSRPLALSFAQQRLWLLLQSEGTSEAYHIPLGIRLRGPLDERALRNALNRLTERHETMRTYFETVDGEGVQRIRPSSTGFALRLYDLTDEPDARQSLATLIREEASTPFDLHRGPLARGRLIRLTPVDHVLLITLHHINSDGWSIGILLRELSLLYGALMQGKISALQGLPIQYADYAAWQRRYLSRNALSEHSAYWLKALSAAPSVLELPTDRPRPAQQRFEGNVVAAEFDATLTAALKSLSQKYSTTLFMTLLAGWAIVLARLSGQDDLVIGTPTANRVRTEVEPLIGLFVNTLPIRFDLSQGFTVGALLRQTRDGALEAQEYQDLPFEQMVELINPVRSAAYTPLFQVMFAWHNNEVAPVNLPGLEVTEVEMPETASKYDLTLNLTENHGIIVGTLNYATALFDETTARRHLSYLARALAEMCANPNQRVSELVILPPEERHRTVVEWNATRAEYPQDCCIHELFEAQVRRTPEAVALKYEGQCLTYETLNSMANRLARDLRTLGVGPERSVGVFMEPSLELVMGLLGILKAGGVYVPLEPSYPCERLAYILNDARPHVVLTQERLRRSLPPTQAEVIALDGRLDLLGGYNDRDVSLVSSAQSARNLAYVIYTSGSTGEPKGIAAEHQGMVNRIAAQATIGPFLPGDICCQKTSIGFVDAIFEILGPLSYGQALVIAPAAAAKDTHLLASLIEAERVTRLVSVPSLAASWLEAGWPIHCLETLRSWTLSGEDLKADLLRQIQERLPNCRFTNLYGSSEVAADVSCFSDSTVLGNKVPIGRPIANTQIYILDGHMQPVPVGVAGEIYIGGAGLARGYLHRPELTHERFVADPFQVDRGARLFKSGDRGRWRQDGMIEYLGRDDYQVKIRGFRIELAEIEARLSAHPDVREAVVVAREESTGERRLVAYVVTQTPSAVGVEDIRSYLRAALPEYMVPRAFVMLDRLPQTPSGKLNRRALPAPQAEAYASGPYETPVGDVEEVLAEIWVSLLGMAQVGRYDNFFELGGHSLLAAKLMDAVARRFKVRLSLVTLLQHQTLQQFASVIESSHGPFGQAEPGNAELVQGIL